MRILIDAGHPGHILLFKNFSLKMIERGHTIKFTIRDKVNIVELARNLDLKYVKRPTSYPGFMRIFSFLLIIISLVKYSKENRIDLIIGGPGNAYVPIVSRLLSIPSLVFDDTEHDKISLTLIKLFTHSIVTPSVFINNLGSKQIRYNGYPELSYLHPEYFTPNPDILKSLGLTSKKYAIIRLVSFDALHDMNHRGIDKINLQKLVSFLSKDLEIIILTSEPLPRELEKHRLELYSGDVHSLLYYARIYLGDSITMCTESTLLGTPSIVITSLPEMGVPRSLEKYGMTWWYKEWSDDIYSLINKILKTSQNHFDETKIKLINDKIDVTSFMLETIEKIGEDGR